MRYFEIMSDKFNFAETFAKESLHINWEPNSIIVSLEDVVR
jgi:hypothetical protein